MTVASPHYFRSEWIEPNAESVSVDACVYGATAAGVVAAVKLARLGHDVVLLNPGDHVGGMTTGGLGWTDEGDPAALGGMARRFYRDVAEVYRELERLPADDATEAVWRFEPSVAARVLRRWLDEAGIVVRVRQFLDHVEVEHGTLERLIMRGGLKVSARVFIDATYEGDLLAAADVPYAVGRESNDRYGETLNGVQVREKHQFVPPGIDPFVVAGDRDSGLLPGVEASDLSGHVGRGDGKVQAYNFRVCMTNDPALKIAWREPPGYDPTAYELAARWFERDQSDAFNGPLPPRRWPHDPPRLRKYDLLTVPTADGYHKTDSNNHGPISSDLIGGGLYWAEADYAQREAIFQSHVRYQLGLYWMLASDPRIPQRIRDAHNHWGLAVDEFADTNHWPPQLYVREARRMRSEVMLTEHHCLGRAAVDDPVAMGSYALDSHNCSRFVTEHGSRWGVMNEGNVEAPTPEPYGVSYRMITPPRDAVGNLLVPVCLSATHIAFGSVRMEPVFMALSESAAIAASLAVESGCRVQDLPYPALAEELDRAGQVVNRCGDVMPTP